ncbi:nucleotidyltransferase family protein [Sphingomonas lacunae]|uniref:nucleotidyltransferase family protein n=1 Tax=Sphingomonas lacunae TaxID=2698828 RepID=UPI001BAEE320|nr:nucleotidyltransferase family protein [Sphingomonas lacunae]
MATSIGDAIKNLNDSGLQIALIVDAEERLIGTVTDGDVRRGLLRGLTLNDSVDSIVHADPLVVPHGLRPELVADLMRINRVGQLPCIDESRRVTGLYLWDQLAKPVDTLDNIFVIMAGGKGVRLRPYTENCPKPLLMVGDKPILQHIIERAALEGFRHFVIAIHYLGEMIVDHFGDGSALGVNITYLREDRPLGTGGALSLMQITPQAPLIVTNGDVLTSIRYTEILEFHERHRAKATMAVRTHELQNPFGVVHTDGVEISRFEEKPTIRSQINAGIYVIDPAALLFLEPNQHCDMPSLFERVIQSSARAVAFPMHETWLDVGRHDDLETARRMAK